MSFLGKDGKPAPKLKDARWSQSRLNRCYHEVLAQMRAMYHECRLVHCDLSEYNLLLWQKMPYIIDVGQSVDVKHPRADEYLYRDCLNVRAFFEKEGATELLDGRDMFKRITDRTITPEQCIDYTAKIACAGRGALKRWEVDLMQDGSSDIVYRHESLPGSDLLEGRSSEDDDDEEEEEGNEEEEDDLLLQSLKEGKTGKTGKAGAEATEATEATEADDDAASQ